MRVISLINQKGGVGKTTSAINIGAGLNLLGKKVLLIDLDPQANLTYSLGIAAHELGRTLYHVLTGREGLSRTTLDRNGLRIIPSSLELAGAENELINIAGREFLLREVLQGVRGIDYIIIDCPPSLGLLTINALTATREVYIPVQTEYLALQGLSRLLETVETVRERLNGSVRISRVIATRYDSRKVLNREVLDRLRAHFKNKLFDAPVRENIALAEAPANGKTIFEYRPKSYGAIDYLNISKQIIGGTQ